MRRHTIFFAMLAAGFLAAPVGAQEAGPTALDAELRGMVAAPANATPAAHAVNAALGAIGAHAADAIPVRDDLPSPSETAPVSDEAELVGGDPIVISSTAVLAALIVLLLVAD